LKKVKVKEFERKEELFISFYFFYFFSLFFIFYLFSSLLMPEINRRDSIGFFGKDWKVWFELEKKDPTSTTPSFTRLFALDFFLIFITTDFLLGLLFFVVFDEDLLCFFFVFIRAKSWG
jgi:hypothetical protein